MSRDIALCGAVNASAPGKRILCGALVLLAAATLSACGSKEKPAGQSIARVNGEEITVHQLNEELQRIGSQQNFSNKQVLDALVDRQLLISEAQRDKIDRDPAVMQAVERAKGQILAQAYMQKKLGNSAKPSKSDVDSFFQQNPDIFAQRKQFELKELIVDAKNLSPELNATMLSAKSLEEVAAWLEDKKVPFTRTQLTRSTADLSPEVIKAMKGMAKGQLFTVKEGSRGLLIALDDVRETPVSALVAAPQIEQYLANKKNKESGVAEIARLRAAAKIEYLNESVVSKSKSAQPESAPAPVAGSKPGNAPGASHIDRGVAGLK